MDHMIPEILAPVIALAGWTMVVWLWMYATRIPAMRDARINPDSLVAKGAKKLDELLPASVQWKAQNYNHLHEAPTLFYAVALVLAMIGEGDGVNAIIAWAYVLLRVVHSLVQVTVNRVMLRFVIFNLSMIALLMLIVHAAMTIFHR